MTEQLITKNLYSLITCGGKEYSSSNANFLMMPDTLSRQYLDTYTSNMWAAFHTANISNIPSYFTLRPVYYSKALTELTESEIYTKGYDIGYNPIKQTCYKIMDDSANYPSGIKLVSVYTNTGSENITVNGVCLRSNDSSKYYILIHSKFDSPITIAPTESCSFTLDLDNIYVTFPTTIGS